MLFGAARHGSMSDLLAVILSLLLVQPSHAQQPSANSSSTSRIREISDYLTRSDHALACDPLAARNLAKRALDAASAARETDHAWIDALGDLKSQSNLAIGSAEKRQEDFDAHERDARKAIKQARLRTANELLVQADPGNCYAGFKAVKALVDQRRSQAESLIRKGDEAFAVHPKKAISLYEKAGKVDAEYPNLASRIASVQLK